MKRERDEEGFFHFFVPSTSREISQGLFRSSKHVKRLNFRRVVVSFPRVLGRRKFEEKVFDSTIGSFLRY